MKKDRGVRSSPALRRSAHQHVKMSAIEVVQTHSTLGSTSAYDPGCVKTRLRITSMRRRRPSVSLLSSLPAPHARMAASNGSTPR
ncbi:hypothetical protein QCM80_39260, partial [Bradyrhizobium sp. SSUT112]|uniref:hypothetical protein n=1 Tax=Bradyrhizobium sp. SSUT112 TaxID=3040604 RepID=UPI002447F79D